MCRNMAGTIQLAVPLDSLGSASDETAISLSLVTPQLQGLIILPNGPLCHEPEAFWGHLCADSQLLLNKKPAGLWIF